MFKNGTFFVIVEAVSDKSPVPPRTNKQTGLKPCQTILSGLAFFKDAYHSFCAQSERLMIKICT